MILATVAFLIGASAPAVLAAGPERIVIDLDDPYVDELETQIWSEE